VKIEMSSKIDDLVRSHILKMPAYQPVLPFEVLSEQLGIPPSQIIKLDANENPYGPLPAVEQALADLDYINIYPDPESRQLRNALADYHNISAENILAAAGADELIDLLMRLLIDPGDVLVDCPPTFGMYAFDGDLNAAQVISVSRKKDFSLDLEILIDTIQRLHPKLLFLANPNNPDGSLIDRQLIEELLALPVVVVLDEAYIEFSPPDATLIQEAPRRENLIVLRTFSKWAGLAGLRVGYGVFPDNLMPHLWKIKQPYNVSVAAATAALTSMQGADQLQEREQKIISERKRLYQGLQAIPWLQPYPSNGNFILCRVLDRDALNLKNTLANSGILVRYFNKPGLTDHIRISIGKPEHNTLLLDRLTQME
jgi:histidinol-phosphate aminotransferase